jgi:hypothetical protein
MVSAVHRLRKVLFGITNLKLATDIIPGEEGSVSQLTKVLHPLTITSLLVNLLYIEPDTDATLDPAIRSIVVTVNKKIKGTKIRIQKCPLNRILKVP